MTTATTSQYAEPLDAPYALLALIEAVRSVEVGCRRRGVMEERLGTVEAMARTRGAP